MRYFTDYAFRKNGTQFWESQSEGIWLPRKVVFGGFGGATPAQTIYKNIKIGTTGYGSSDVWAPTISGSGSDANSLVPPFDNTNYPVTANNILNAFASSGEFHVNCTPDIFSGGGATKDLGADFLEIYIQFEVKMLAGTNGMCAIYSSDGHFLLYIGVNDVSISSSTFDTLDIRFTAEPLPSVTFGYDGHNKLTATLETTPGDQYIMFLNSDSAGATLDAAGVISTIEVNDAGTGKDAGDLIMANIQKTTGAQLIGVPIEGACIVQKGTPGGQYPFDATWSYDGDKEVSVEFFAESDFDYALFSYAFRDAEAFETGSSEPTWPTTLNDSVSDGDYTAIESFVVWDWAASSVPVGDSRGGNYHLIIKDGSLWRDYNGSGITGATEPTWIGNTDVVDGGYHWHRQLTMTTWSANAHYSTSNTTQYIKPTTFNGHAYSYFVGNWQRLLAILTGDDSVQTLAASFPNTPVDSFNPSLQRF